MKQKTSISILLKGLPRAVVVIVGLAGLFILPSPVFAVDPPYFETADQAANTLVIAVAQRDRQALSRILGDNYLDLVPEQLDVDDLQRFITGWSRFHTLLAQGPGKRVLTVGESGWTLPIPIIREDEGWRFDTAAGARNIRIRRIGANELSAMQAALAYHDAQVEYAQSDRDSDGILEYAQRFISTPGGKDGLFWTAEPGEVTSPLGPRFAEKRPEGAYHGYYYRILTAQGEHAPGGAFDYRVNGNMVRGFALIAWPAKYGESGVMSFMISRDGTLFEADLGPEGGTIASSASLFDPDNRWAPVLTEYTGL